MVLESTSRPVRLMAAVMLALLWSVSMAHGEGHGGGAAKPTVAPVEETAFGRAGDPARVNRTIDIEMSDAMRFSPAELTIKLGQTVRFNIRNKGKLLHEMVIGTKKELAEHAEMMRKHPNMQHDEPHMAHVAPSKQETLVWQFTKPGQFHFACLIPGHYEAGMTGTILVR